MVPMPKPSVCSLAALGFLLAVTSGAIAAPRTANPCRQMQRDFDRRIDDLKKQQDDALQGCRNTNGKDSSACSDLKNQQKKELQELRSRRSAQLNGCGQPATTVTNISTPNRTQQENCDVYKRADDDDNYEK